jgi:hypothetical protein
MTCDGRRAVVIPMRRHCSLLVFWLGACHSERTTGGLAGIAILLHYSEFGGYSHH